MLRLLLALKETKATKAIHKCSPYLLEVALKQPRLLFSQWGRGGSKKYLGFFAFVFFFWLKASTLHPWVVSVVISLLCDLSEILCSNFSWMFGVVLSLSLSLSSVIESTLNLPLLPMDFHFLFRSYLIIGSSVSHIFGTSLHRRLLTLVIVCCGIVFQEVDCFLIVY